MGLYLLIPLVFGAIFSRSFNWNTSFWWRKNNAVSPTTPKQTCSDDHNQLSDILQHLTGTILLLQTLKNSLSSPELQSKNKKKIACPRHGQQAYNYSALSAITLNISTLQFTFQWKEWTHLPFQRISPSYGFVSPPDLGLSSSTVWRKQGQWKWDSVYEHVIYTDNKYMCICVYWNILCILYMKY